MDLTQRLTDLDREINEINNRTKALTNQLTDVVSHEDELTAQTIRRQLEELQLSLEDKTIMRTAVESKLHFIPAEQREHKVAVIINCGAHKQTTPQAVYDELLRLNRGRQT
jgi:predicted  nucleic acid-binding Zn-ribbon protein